jgi:hypothetical protein
MAALAICAVTAAMLRDRTDTQAPPPAAPDAAPPADPGLIPLTIPEIRRLLADATRRPKPPGHGGADALGLERPAGRFRPRASDEPAGGTAV